MSEQSLAQRIGQRLGNGYNVLRKAIDDPQTVLNQPLNRRNLFDAAVASLTTLACAGVVVTLFSGCELAPAEDTAPDPNKYPEYASRITDPTQKAASVFMRTPVPLGFEADGHAGLFQETSVDGKTHLYIVSAYHVATGGYTYHIEKPIQSTILIPNGDKPFTISKSFFWKAFHNSKIETIPDGDVQDGVFYTELTEDIMGLEEFNRLRNTIYDNKIRPLIPASFDDLTHGTSLISFMPDTGTPATFEFDHYDAPSDSYGCKLTSGRVCEGFSGQPILRCIVDANGKNIGYTNQSYGVLSSDYNDPGLFSQCANPGKNWGNDLVYFRAIPPKN